MKDYRKYVATIDAQRDHLVRDPGYLQILHQQEFAGSRSGKNKENKCVWSAFISLSTHRLPSIRYRQRVLCFILSHVNATGSSSAKLALLRSLASVSDSVKAELLVPTMQSLIRDPSTVHGQATLFGPCAEDLAILVVSSFDDSAANDLNDQESLLWAVFLRVLRHYFKPS
jgi:U3 small nucleolar RNA-associated protein 10